MKGDGVYWVNPFCVAANPAAETQLGQSNDVTSDKTRDRNLPGGKKISLKIMTLNNARRKINDCLGNPVEIGIVVTWQVKDTVKAVFNVDNYKEYLSLQCDSALRNIVRIHPYDVDITGDGIADAGSLRGSSEMVAARIKNEIQQRVDEAGVEISEARITYLA